jgi:hypothetical protein
VAIAEQACRIEAAAAVRLVREAEERAFDAAMQKKLKLAREQREAARRARKIAPEYIAKLKNQQLRAQYSIDGSISESCFGRLINIQKKVDVGEQVRRNVCGCRLLAKTTSPISFESLIIGWRRNFSQTN